MHKRYLIILICFQAFFLTCTEINFGMRIDRGAVENDELSELSGLGLSNMNNSVLWAHNDSGGETAVYAMGLNGNHLGKYYLEGITFRDVEDICIFDHAGNFLLIADIGDNAGTHNQIYIYKVIEPEVDAGQSPVTETIPADHIETIILEYPDDLHYDSETIFADNILGDIYLVTKRGADNPFSDNYDYVYKAEYPQSTVTVNILEETASLDIPTYMDYGVTAGDLSHSGRELLLKTYDAVYYWEVEAGEDIEDALSDSPVSVYYELEAQGEAICWADQADGYYTSSEENGGYPARLSFYPRLTSYIQITQQPTGLYRASEEIQIIWGPAGLYNQLYISDMPGGEILENYEASGVWGEDILLTSPNELGLSVGVYRGILHNPEFDYLSIEFPMIVESANAVQMIYPPNGGTITESLPEFQWAVNPGVPYYLIAVSDTPFEIEHDENGDAIVAGIETVWQALTFDTYIMYGMPDPSGYFENAAPPLIPGQEYNWIVVNNYGNDPLLSSKVVGSPFSFHYSSENEMDPPVLLSPQQNSSHNSFEINFSWTEVFEAMYYQIQVFEVRHQGSNSGNYLVWDQTTTNTDIDMNAEGILIDSDYNWKVYATNAEEISSVSETGIFSYEIETGTLALHVRDNYGSPVPFATAEIDPIDGSSDDFPLAVNSAGNEDKILPVGEYIIEVSKEGFETRDSVFTIEENEETNLIIELAYSPSYFYGQVVDENGYLIDNAAVKAYSFDGEEREADASYGSFIISVTPGDWTIKSEKTGWLLVTDRSAEIEAGENIQIEPLIMTESTKDIQGSIVRANGFPLQRAYIFASHEEGSYQTMSNENGQYIFNGVEFGSYEIMASKPGYTALNSIDLNISIASPSVTTADDIVLQPASMINGTANDGVVGLKDVVITAIPASGNAIYTTTNGYGDYTINLLAGTYNIGANKVNYTNQSVYQINLGTGETLDNLDFILLPNDAHVTGMVYSEGSGLEGVMLIAGDNHAETNSSGYYDISIYPGTYNLSAFKQGYTVNRDYRISLGPGEQLDNINFELYPNASVVNGVTHNNGTIVGAANVFAKKQGSSSEILNTMSNSDGEYSYSFNYGSYKIWAGKQNFVCLPEDTVFVSVAPGEVLNGIDVNLTPVESYISGRVVNGQELGIEGAHVSAIFNDLEYNTITGNFGSFSFTVEPNVSYMIAAWKTGYSTSLENTDVLEIGEEYYLEMTLEQLPSTISGRTFDISGSPLSSVTVSAIGNEDYSTVSGGNGSWLISLFAGDYLITASKPGYLESSQEITLVPGNQIDSLDFYLEDNFAILEGYVINETTGEPLEDVLITANAASGGGSSTYTDDMGFYQFTRLFPGLYSSITFTKPGYYSSLVSNQVLPGSYTSIVDVLLEPYVAAIEAYVTSEGNPLAGATINAENQLNGVTVSEITNDNGYCILNEITSLIPYIVSVSKVNYTSVDTLIYPIPDDTMTVYFDVIRIDGQINGFIYDQNGNPVSSANVSAVSEDGYSSETMSGLNGSYFLENLAVNRNYYITAAKQGYSQEEIISVFLSEEPINLDITIYAHDFQVTGILHDQGSYTLEGIQVFCEGEITGDQTMSGEDGSFILGELAPFSVYNFWTLASENGYENLAWQDTLLSSDIDLGIITVPVFLSSFSGILTDENTGSAISGAIITAENQQTSHTYGAVSQLDGSYNIRFLYEGLYDLRYTAENYSTINMDSVYVDHREESVIDLMMQYNSPVQISGTVQDEHGRLYEEIPVDLISGSLEISVVTDQNGEFYFAQAPPYSEVIITTMLPVEDYDNSWLQINTEAINLTGITLVIDVHTAQLNGQVFSEDQPLSHAQITLSNADTLLSVTTGTEGEYEFENLYEGIYDLSCFRPGYQGESRTIEIADFDVLAENFDLPHLSAAISGIVSSDQEPWLANAIVELWQNDVLIETDTTISGGSFQFEDLSLLEEFELRVTKLGFENYIHAEMIFPGETVNLELSGIANSLSGTIYLQNEPVPECSVKIRDLDNQIQETTCNQFGDYLFTNINGYFDVWAEYADTLISITASVIVNTGNSTRLHLSLTDAAEISGRMLYADLPKPGVTVTASHATNGSWTQDITEQDGIFRLRGLSEGTYDLDFFCAGYEFIDPPDQVSVEMGETIDLLDIEMTFMQNAISGVVQRAQERFGISDALVTLLDSLNTPIDIYLTEADGAFLFSPVQDGTYFLRAEHPAYYEAEDMEVTLINGNSTPPVIEFDLEPKELFIYGYVGTDNETAVEGAVVTAELVSRNDMHKQLSSYAGNKSLLRSISDTTNADGFYQIIADTIGVWNLNAECDDYYPSESVNIELTWLQNWYQQDFYLQPQILYADIMGTVKIFDETWLPFDTFSIRLQSENGIDMVISEEHPDSLYAFEDLVIPDVFSLELNAMYNDRLYHDYIDNIVITEESVHQENFEFVFEPDTWDIEGFIYMKDNGLNTLGNAEIVLTDLEGQELIEYTTPAGYYLFSSIEEGAYHFEISAEYEDENFSYQIDSLMINENVQINHYFQYFLCELEIKVADSYENGLSSAELLITGNDVNIELQTDENGNCTTGAILHTGEYQISMNSVENDTLLYLASSTETILLESLGYYQNTIELPLWYAQNEYDAVYNYNDSIDISLNSSGTFNGNVHLIYRNLNGNLIELHMQENNDQYGYTIPPQNAPGVITFWFAAADSVNGRYFSNTDSPHYIEISAEGIPSEEYSQILPDNPVIPFGSDITLELEIKDALGNDLNELMADEADVNWSISNGAIGTIYSDPLDPLQLHFTASTSGIPELQADITAEIYYQDFYIQCSTEITTGDFYVSEIEILGISETSNSSPAEYDLNIYSEQGRLLTLAFDNLQVPDHTGSVSFDNGLINYSPDSDFIGKTEISASVQDPQTLDVFSASKVVTVYQKVNSQTPSRSLHTGASCEINLYQQMLANPQTQARLYVLEQYIPPYEEVDIASETRSRILNASSNLSESAWNTLPGMKFISSENDLMFAQWNNRELRWEILTENDPEIENIPHLGKDYAAVSNSKKLGIYDLKLLPNPFTPYDMIGSNPGMQISFRISSRKSRYIKITAKIFTINGETVRELAVAKTLLKGEYQPGDENTLYWDGYTDNGKMARNGRYLLQLIAEDSENRQELLKSIVLIK